MGLLWKEEALRPHGMPLVQVRGGEIKVGFYCYVGGRAPWCIEQIIRGDFANVSRTVSSDSLSIETM